MSPTPSNTGTTTTPTTTTSPVTTESPTTKRPHDATQNTPSGSKTSQNGSGENGENSNNINNQSPGGSVSPPGNASQMILWITAGTIIGLVISCGCIFLCCPSNAKAVVKKRLANGGASRQGSRRIRNRNDNRRGSRMGTRHVATDRDFDSFKDGPLYTDEEDEDDEEIQLQMGPLSSGKQQHYGGKDEFEDF
tara:strand:+ start:42 stop:620 length:579 start_codon:yes stop_codon:yes gene_type:complete